MMIPSVEKCLSLMEDQAMLDNIRAHSIAVALVADTLLDRLVYKGVADSLPERDLVMAGALLHDIAKTQCLDNRCNHARVGGDICQQLGYSDIAEIVKEHVIMQEYSVEDYGQGHFRAKEIVYYADKRVMHDEIVSLEQRLEYILQRYGNGERSREILIRENFSYCQQLEKYLFKFLDFMPDQLLQQTVTREQQFAACINGGKGNE